MTTISTAASYDAIPAFGTLYDAIPVYRSRGDVGFYVSEAARVEGPILEIGCGTGRVLIPMARAGASVVGIDGSDEMLARCHAQLASEPEAVRSRIEVHRADARAFSLGRTFPLVVAPFRIFQQLVTIDDQLRCLDTLWQHLATRGRLIFDVFNPSFAVMVKDRSAEHEDTPWLTLPDGQALRRTVRIERVRWTEQVSETELIYYLAPSPGATPARHVQRFDMRWYLRAELEHLLARCGFRVESVFGDFDRSRLTDQSPELVFVASRI